MPNNKRLKRFDGSEIIPVYDEWDKFENYEDFDKNTCLDEASVSKSISSLYPIRKNKEYICSDDALEPATRPQQAEMLLKGMKAIEMIINGENIPMSEVKNVKIN